MFASAGDGDTAVMERGQPARPRPKEPVKFNVILHDDDHHSFTYVMELLQKVFKYDSKQAYKLTEEVVEHGKAVVHTAASRCEARMYQEQIHGNGKDHTITDCQGSMTATIEEM